MYSVLNTQPMKGSISFDCSGLGLFSAQQSIRPDFSLKWRPVVLSICFKLSMLPKTLLVWRNMVLLLSCPWQLTHLRDTTMMEKFVLFHLSGCRGGNLACFCSTSLTPDSGSNLVVTEILDRAVSGESANQIQTG